MKKEQESFEIEKHFNSTSRIELRSSIVKLFLEEKKGYWTADGHQVVTHYKYFVETLKDGRRIYLLRPTFLNKGIDFQVVVERLDGVHDKRPSHKDLLLDILFASSKKPTKLKVLLKAIKRVWQCEDPDKVLKEIDLSFKLGFPPDLVLKALKWLFIEQDITYWNYDGRMMLWKSIQSEVQGGQ